MELDPSFGFLRFSISKLLFKDRGQLSALTDKLNLKKFNSLKEFWSVF